MILDLGGTAISIVADVTDAPSIDRAVERTKEAFGDCDILVNNAGILRDNTIVRMSEPEWDAVIAVHLKGHYTTLHHAAGYWRAQAKAGKDVRASVVNTSSASGLLGNPGQLNYAAAKAGIAAMTLVGAQELSRYGVRVNAIAPIARTRLTLQTPGWDERLRVEEGAFDMWAPENITPLVAWLASDTCPITGQVFNVIGGHIGWNEGWTERISLDHPDRAWTEDELSEAMSEAGVPTSYGARAVDDRYAGKS